MSSHFLDSTATLAPAVVGGDVFARLSARLAAMEDAGDVDFTAMPGWSSKIVRASPTADDIPIDPVRADAPATYPVVLLHRHEPRVTLLRDGKTVVVKGPVERRLPATTPATALGWTKYAADIALHDAKSQAAAKGHIAEFKEYFRNRRLKRDAAAEAKYVRACKRALKAGREIPARPVQKEPPWNWTQFCKNEKLIEMMRAAARAAGNKKRLKRYVGQSGLVADRPTLRFIEEFFHADGTRAKALRSCLGVVALELFNSAVDKWAVYGRSKREVVHHHGTSRLSVIDAEYIETSRFRRVAHAVDLDGCWFPSAEALRAKLREKLPPEFMPAIIVSREPEQQPRQAPRGGIEDPHLIWPLPPGSRVINANSAAKAKQARLHDMIQNGLVALLMPLGADPCHTNVRKVKNPLSPKWNVDCCDDHFPTLDEWRAFLPTITPDRRAMMRQAKLAKIAATGNGAATLSSPIFNDGVVWRRILIRSAQQSRDKVFLAAIRKSHSAFVSWMYHPTDGVVTRKMLALHSDKRAIVLPVLAEQRDLVEREQMTPSACACWSDRGRDAALNETISPSLGPTATKSERQAQEQQRKKDAGPRSRRSVRDRHCGLLAEAMEARPDHVEPSVKTAIITALVFQGFIGRSTAYDLWKEVAATVRQAARYQADLFPSDPDPVVDVSVEEVAPVVVDAPSVVAGPGPVKSHAADGGPSLDPENSIDPADPESIERANIERAKYRRAFETRERWRGALSTWRRRQIDVPTVEQFVQADPVDHDDWVSDAIARIDASTVSFRRQARSGPTIH